MSKVSEYRYNLLGKEFETNSCGKCFIIDYSGNKSVIIAFYEPVCIIKCSISNLRKGQVLNPLYPSVYGVGYLGQGVFSNKDIKIYDLWTGLLRRCLSSKFLTKNPTYKDVTICEEWLNFQNFAEWCTLKENFNSLDDNGKPYQLDKDILVKGNKIYSPETCCFVPQRINNLFTFRNNSRGNFPLGVQKARGSDKFISVINGFKNLGRFNTPEEAFYAYKKIKECLIKEVAEGWKERISLDVYNSLMSWEIEITD